MKVQELLDLLAKLKPETELTLSVDFNPKNPYQRVFATDISELLMESDSDLEATIVFDGYLNDDEKG